MSAKKAVATLSKEKVNTSVEAVESTTTPMNPPENVYSSEIVKEMDKRRKSITSELSKVESSFTKIAFNLYWIKDHDAFKALGYKNIYDFAKVEFGIARGTCNNFINVVNRFAKRVDGAVVEQIDDCYKGFKSSQLILMLDLSDSDIKKLDMGLSVRDMKKEIKKLTSDDTDGTTDSDSSSDDSQAENVVDVESKEVNRQVLITVRTLEEYDSQEDKIYAMIKRALNDPKHQVEIAYTW
jgi:hypothetical protein